MARFYGTIQGQRGMASRLGHSSLQVTAQSYTGDVRVHLGVIDGINVVSLYACEHGHGFGTLLYHGPIKHLLDRAGHAFLIEEMARRALEKEHQDASE